MTSLTEFLFPAPARRTPRAILGWWERRRLAYNVFVGGAGLVSVGWMAFLSAVTPWWGGPAFLPWQPIVVFGVMANVCYLLGPSIELLVEKLWGGKVLPVGPALYRMGLTFSVGLALFPALLVSIAWVVNLVAKVLGIF